MNATFFQTGDLAYYPLGFPFAADPVAKEVPPDAKRVRGNQIHATDGGNSHGFKGEGAVFKHGDRIFLHAKEDLTLVHPEHKDVTLFKGTYEVRHVQEKDHFGDLVRPVID